MCALNMMKYLQTFIHETKERLTVLNKSLVALEKSPNNVELIQTINRESHNIKGAAGMMGFKNIQDIAHRIEDMFIKISQGNTAFNLEIMNDVFKDLDSITIIMNELTNQPISDENPVFSP